MVFRRKAETSEIPNCLHISTEYHVATFIRGLAIATVNGLKCFRHNDNFDYSFSYR